MATRAQQIEAARKQRANAKTDAQRKAANDKLRQLGVNVGTGGTTPKAQIRAPLGYYDPSLEASRRQSRRGLADLQKDIGIAGGRAAEDYDTGETIRGRDYGRGLADIGQARERGLFDLGRQEQRGGEDFDRSEQRGLFDYDRQEQRGTEDYQRSLSDLARSYGVLARSQGQNINASGTRLGGALAQAAAKRASNQAYEREPLDKGFQRFGEDIGTGRQRLGEDIGRGRQRLGEDIGTARGRLLAESSEAETEAGEDYGLSGQIAKRDLLRGGEDRYLGGQRALREQKFYEADVTSQELFQAHQAGADLGGLPGLKKKLRRVNKKPARRR